MTDTNAPRLDDEPQEDGKSTGVERPDQGAANLPGRTPGGPASGGEGAAGAGGSDGFGTGT